MKYVLPFTLFEEQINDPLKHALDTVKNLDDDELARLLDEEELPVLESEVVQDIEGVVNAIGEIIADDQQIKEIETVLGVNLDAAMIVTARMSFENLQEEYRGKFVQRLLIGVARLFPTLVKLTIVGLATVAVGFILLAVYAAGKISTSDVWTPLKVVGGILVAVSGSWAATVMGKRTKELIGFAHRSRPVKH